MKTITVQQAQEVIEKLAEPQAFVCGELAGQEVPKPVLLGDAVAKFTEIKKKTSPDLHDLGVSAIPLIELWQPCGFNRSLQTILKEADKGACKRCDGWSPKCVYGCEDEPIYGPAAELFLHLETLFFNEN